MEDDNNWIIFNGELKRAGEGLFGPNARTVMYGDGCFETFRSYKGRFLHLNEHMERLRMGMEYLEIDKSNILTDSNLEDNMSDILSRNRLTDRQAVMRLQIWRDGGRGYMPDRHSRAGYLLAADPLPQGNDSWELATVSTRRIPNESLASRFKLSGGANYIKASTEAARSGADDALMLTTDSQIAETTVANIFWLSGNTVYTPSPECDLLPGITRGILLKLLREMDQVQVEEGQYRLEDIHAADAVWICNSLKEILPVSRIDDHTYESTHPVLIRLQGAFRRYAQEKLESL